MNWLGQEGFLVNIKAAAIAILAMGLGSAAFAEGTIGSKLDIDTNLGGGIYNDSVAGFSGAIGAALPLRFEKLPVDLDVGIDALFQAASSTEHSQQDYYLLADMGASWKAFASASGALAPLALRADLGLGGGWTSDTADSSTKGMAGFIVWPRLGLSYPVGPVELSAEGGFQFITGDKTAKKVVTFGLGCRYALELGGKK
jgi:hypothetical protein